MPCGFRQEDFKVFILRFYFSLCDLDMQRPGTILTIVKECHIKIIPVKSGQNLLEVDIL